MSTLVPMTLEKYEEILNLWKSDPGIGLTRSDNREELERFLLRNPGMSFLSLDDGGRITGTVMAGHDGRRGFIYHLFVTSDSRGTGLGRALTERSLEALKGEGIEKVHIMVFAANGGGRTFWSRAGFSERDDITLMSRTLDAAAGSGCGC